MYEFEEYQRGVAMLNKGSYLALGQPEAVKLPFDR